MVTLNYPYLLYVLVFRSRYILQGVSAICYNILGQDRNLLPSDGPNEYQPCNAGDEFSMCCGVNRTYPRIADGCRRDGLCFNPGTSQLWRESCTDPSWQSPSCTKICLTGMTDNGVLYGSIDYMLTECSDKSICCGHMNTTCCAKGEGVWIKDGETTKMNPYLAKSLSATFITTILSSIQPTSNLLYPTSSTSISNPPQATLATSPHSKGGQSSGKVVGGCIGGACGMILIAGLIWYIRSRRALLSQRQESVRQYKEPHGNTQAQGYEVSGTEVRPEMSGLGRVELGV